MAHSYQKCPIDKVGKGAIGFITFENQEDADRIIKKEVSMYQ
jgi:hypothetical protein